MLGAQDPEGGLAVGRGDDRLVRVRGDLAGRGAVHLAVHADDAAERGDRIGLEGVAVRLDELVVRGQADRVRVLDDRDRRRRVVAGDPIRRIEVHEVVEARQVARDPGRVGERAAAVRRLAVERRALVRVLAVAQVVHLLEDDREAARERVAGDLVEVGGDLGVIRGDRAERLGRQLGPRLGADLAHLADLVGDPGVVGRIGDGRDPGRVPGRRAEQRRAADIDHLDRLVEADELDADGRRERLDVDDDEVDEADALGLQLRELGRHVAAREDPGVDGVVEGLDLPADGGAAGGQVRDGRDLDAFTDQVLAGPIGREELDLQRAQVAGHGRDPIPVGHG